MSEYKFDAVRWLRSNARAHHARKDFDTSSTMRTIAEEIDNLRTRLAEVEAQRDELKTALDTIQSGFEYRNGDPKMDGTFDRFPHVLNRSAMKEIAREALAKLEAVDALVGEG